MPSKIVATMEARRTTFLGIRVATFQLTENGCVIQHAPGGGVISLRDEDGALRDFSSASPDDCLAALRAAVTGEGWQVAP